MAFRAATMAAILCLALISAACDQPARTPEPPGRRPPQNKTIPKGLGYEAEAIALRYNRALSRGNCEAARELGGKSMGPDSSYAQWCEPTDYQPGARGIRLRIKGWGVRGTEATVRFVQRMCLVGAASGDPQTRVYSGQWTIDLETDEIVREERRETSAHFDCEPPLLEGGS